MERAIHKLDLRGSINFNHIIEYEWMTRYKQSTWHHVGGWNKKLTLLFWLLTYVVARFTTTAHLYLHNNSLHLGDLTLSNSDGVLQIPSGINLGEASLSVDDQGIIHFPASGIMVGAAEVKPDPGDPQSLYFSKTPQVQKPQTKWLTWLQRRRRRRCHFLCTTSKGGMKNFHHHVPYYYDYYWHTLAEGSGPWSKYIHIHRQTYR